MQLRDLAQCKVYSMKSLNSPSFIIGHLSSHPHTHTNPRINLTFVSEKVENKRDPLQISEFLWKRILWGVLYQGGVDHESGWEKYIFSSFSVRFPHWDCIIFLKELLKYHTHRETWTYLPRYLNVHSKMYSK